MSYCKSSHGSQALHSNDLNLCGSKLDFRVASKVFADWPKASFGSQVLISGGSNTQRAELDFREMWKQELLLRDQTEVKLYPPIFEISVVRSLTSAWLPKYLLIGRKATCGSQVLISGGFNTQRAELDFREMLKQEL